MKSRTSFRLLRKRSILVCALLFLAFSLALVFVPRPAAFAAGESVQVTLTTADQNNKLSSQNALTFANGSSNQSLSLNVDENTTYQQMVGIGASLNGSSVWELENKLNQSQRNALMQQLFDPTNGIGMSMLRQPIGGSDQDGPNQPCSYDDNGGNADPNLNNFSLGYDASSGMIGLIQQAMQLNPALTTMATTWCVPQWMLTGSGNNSTLNSTYYGAYANYLVKYIQAYAAQNPSIPIWGITPQNEPVYSYADFGDNITASQEDSLIANNLGPTFANNGLNTKIIAYDHNWDNTSYPETILNDSAASQYVAGTAWHKYAGSVSAQTTVHNLYPNKGTFFTEASPSTGNTDWSTYFSNMGQYIDILRNWSQTFIEWTIASNPQFGPGSCSNCGALVYIDDNTGAINYSVDYYLVGQMSKFVKPGAYRIASDDLGSGSLRTVAFKNPDGSKALIVYNDASSSQTFGVNWGGENFAYTLPANGVATFTWSGTQGAGGGDTALNRSGWTATASSSYGGDVPANLLDGNLSSRWSTGHAQNASNNDYFQIDMGASQTVDKLVMDSTHDSGDYARGYALYLSNDGSNWGSPVATGSGSSPTISVSFNAQSARYVKVVETATPSDPWWWSVDEVNIYTPGSGNTVLNRSGWNATASSSYGGDVPANLLDGSLSSRWSTGHAQNASNNDYFQIDMGSSQTIDKLVMNSSDDAGDYARGYALYLSNDGSNWGSPVATGSGSSAIISISFSAQSARYVKVVETATPSDPWWWSIDEVNVYV